MKTLIAILLLAASRPPDLTPEQVPFPYDPNRVTSGIINYVLTRPGESFIYDISVCSAWGLNAELTITTPDPNTLLVTKLGKFKDPQGGYRQRYRMVWTPPADVNDIYYIEISAKAWLSRTDRRTLLVYSVAGDDPFIFYEGPPPVAHWLGGYQQFVQIAKKCGVATSKPVHVRM